MKCGLLVPADQGYPGLRAIKRVCCCSLKTWLSEHAYSLPAHATDLFLIELWEIFRSLKVSSPPTCTQLSAVTKNTVNPAVSKDINTQPPASTATATCM